MKHAIRHLHFVGVGGSGMSALAEIHHRLGYVVTGSDREAGDATARLQSLGVAVRIGHDAAHAHGADAVVASTAVPADNPELAAARAAGIPVVPRAVLLAELLRTRLGIAVAGTHGKTTTTSLVAAVLQAAGTDPSWVIGGELLSAGANAHLGGGEAIVVEADESDASFLHLSPVVAVVTNIDADHMDTYGHSVERLRGAFVEFVHRLPFYGRAVVCADDPGVAAVLPRLQRCVTTYGLGAGAELRAVDVQALPGVQMHFVARQAGRPDLPLTLNLAGEHNVRNALAALAVAREFHLPDAAAAAAFAAFAGVGRRFQRHGELPAQGGGRYALVDDYGHHPAELAAVIAAARGAWPGRRLVVAFQPHRYTRTRDCMDGFAAVLREADAVLLCDVYAAGEAPIGGADARELARRIPGVEHVGGVDSLAPAIAHVARGGDVVITLGAGSIAAVAPQLARAAAQQQQQQPQEDAR